MPGLRSLTAKNGAHRSNPRIQAASYQTIRGPFPDVEIPDASFAEFVLARAGELGEKPALIDAPSGRTITYARLVESVRGTAKGLAERGFRKGDVFAHFAPNRPEYAVAVHAVASLGGVNTTANPLLTAGELAARRLVRRNVSP